MTIYDPDAPAAVEPAGGVDEQAQAESESEEDVQPEAEAVASATLTLAPGFVGRAVPPPRAHRSTSSWPPSAVY